MGPTEARQLASLPAGFPLNLVFGIFQIAVEAFGRQVCFGWNSHAVTFGAAAAYSRCGD
jgi:hypothetical protein